VIVAADAHLLVLKANTGQLLQKFPVVHSPYSMLSLNKDFGILGAGELAWASQFSCIDWYLRVIDNVRLEARLGGLHFSVYEKRRIFTF
jgi:hypothetical protein